MLTAITVKGDASSLGYVGIGTTTPTEKLEVEGSIKATELKVGSTTLTADMLSKVWQVIYSSSSAIYARLTSQMFFMLPTFCIWAEENADIAGRSTSEWSFGNGASGYPLARGLVIGVPKCRVMSMTLDIGKSAAFPNTSTVQLTKNGTSVGYGVQTSTTYDTGRRTGYSTPTTEIIFTGGQVVNFKTTQGGSTTQRGVVCVWFERLE